MKKWDLGDLLEGHEGVILWSPLCGECELRRVGRPGVNGTELLFPIMVRGLAGSHYHSFMRDGRYSDDVDGRCLLWPKEGVYSWEDVKWVSSTEFVIDGGYALKFKRLFRKVAPVVRK